MRKPLLPIAALCVLTALLGYGLLAGLPSAPSGARVGQEFPPFELPALKDGFPLNQESLPREPFLLNVWASWCPGCLAEHEYLMTLAEQGIALVCLNYRDEPENALAWLTKRGDPCRFHIKDQAGQLALDLGVSGAPESFLVDAEGIIRHHHLGVLDAVLWQEQLLPVMARISR